MPVALPILQPPLDFLKHSSISIKLLVKPESLNCEQNPLPQFDSVGVSFDRVVTQGHCSFDRATIWHGQHQARERFDRSIVDLRHGLPRKRNT